MRLSKSSSRPPEPTLSSEPTLSESSLPPILPREPQAKVAPSPAVIGPKIVIKGDISGDEDLVIEGRVEGSVHLAGQHLTIGPNGSVKANVSARTITVKGKVEGDLMADERIVICQHSTVHGNVVSARVSLDDGAHFRGTIDMDVKPVKDIKLPGIGRDTSSESSV